MDHERRAGKPEEDSRENNVAGGEKRAEESRKIEGGAK